MPPSSVGAIRELAQQCAIDLGDFEYDFLYDTNRHLFSIGYSVTDHRLDNSFYDLLASEARLASFIAIAQNKLPQEHWFHLGRRVTTQRRQADAAVVERLDVRVPDAAAGDADRTRARCSTCDVSRGGRSPDRVRPRAQGAVGHLGERLLQVRRAAQLPVPRVRRAGPGLQARARRRPRDRAVRERDGIDGRRRARPRSRTCGGSPTEEKQLGPFGFLREAIDYTPSRLPPGKPCATVKSYMAHHQGMAFLALAYELLGRPMQRRFLADPAVRATDLLLHERVPRTASVYPHPAEVSLVRTAPDVDRDLRVFTSPVTPAPEVQLLSNGNYHVVVTNAGGGYAKWRDLEVTRWQEDPTRDAWGQVLLRPRCLERQVLVDRVSADANARAASYEGDLLGRSRGSSAAATTSLDTHVEIAVSAPRTISRLRRITISNHAYAEAHDRADLASPRSCSTHKGADASHRAFSGLFVQSEIIESQQAILCTRRPRSPRRAAAVAVAPDGRPRRYRAADIVYETDRADFIGRDGTPADPARAASQGARQLAGLGARSVRRDPQRARGRCRSDGPAPHRDRRDRDPRSRTRARRQVPRAPLRRARARARVGAEPGDPAPAQFSTAGNAEIRLWEQLAGHVIYANPTLRAPRRVIAANRLGQAGLWPYSISGDLPIVIVRGSRRAENLELVRQLVRAHTYWRLKGLAVDLVIWNEDPSGYRQNLQDQIMAAIAVIGDASLVDQKGGIFIRRTDQMTDPDRLLMMTVARVILADTAGTLAEQLDRRPRNEPVQPVKFEKQKSRGGTAAARLPLMHPA